MIYLDNAASTRPTPEVIEAMARAATDAYANPSSAHGLGAAAARLLEAARAQLAGALGADAGEIVFTSGGTEADALGVLGAAGVARGRHVVVTAIEHPAVIRSAEMLVARGFTLDAVAPRPTGAVAAEDVLRAVRPDTALVAVMLVNNELGTVQPVRAVAQALAALPAGRRPHLHVDAVQAFGFMPVRPRELGCDSLAVSAHKLHGPKGAGALWLRAGARLAPLWDGGRQERGLRSGTENVAGWVGFGVAAASASLFREAGAAARVEELRDRLERLACAALPGARPTVTGAARAPHITSLAIPGLPAEPLLHALEARGVYVSAGSACASKTRGPSPVLKAIGVDDDTAVLRLSLSRNTTGDEIEAAVGALRAAADEIRAGHAGPA